MSFPINQKLFNTPEGFFNAIPTNVIENLEFRKTLHTILDHDKKLQQIYLQLCLLDPKIAFNSLFWTSNPRKPPGERHQPFILRKPKQEECVDTLNWCITNQHDLGINKSRDEGATEIVCKTFALLSLIPDSYFIVGSRNKELVDSIGDPYTLMAKVRYAFDTLPPWMNFIKGSIEDKDMQITIKETGSVIRGETTNESFSAGRRATAEFLDEFGRVDPRIAESIEGSVHDVSGCVIYGSTHWYGVHHAFNKALKKSTTKVVNMLWYHNPEKRAGLYKSPDYGIIEVVDTEYYQKNYPHIPLLHVSQSFDVKELEKYPAPTPKFIADKCEALPKGADLRSPWHDNAEESRKGNFRDFVSNVWGSPIGSQDSVFSTIILGRIEEQHVKSPTHEGELLFDINVDGKIVDIRFVPGGRARLKFWGELDKGIPNLEHNYVIGCDPSLGTGNSNSVAMIFDSNTNEIVGSWVCPNTPYELFADTVVALGRWLGEAFIIFENNGGHGINFGRRLIKRNYHRVYTQRVEDAKTRKAKNKWGWSSNTNSKSDLLGEFGIALSEGLKTNSNYYKVIIHDRDLLDELYRYVYYEDGDIGSSEFQDVTSGARKRHGDRVIAAGLCILGSKYQRMKPKVEIKKVNIDSFEYRKQDIEERELENSKDRRKFWY